MPRPTGTADLPLHGGRAPAWLFERMQRLAPAVVEAIVADHGPDEVLRRLADPHWFQAFGCVLGFDWHSSGVTTVVCGALKTGLAERGMDTGLYVAGGKGRASRRTPDELRRHAAALGVDGDALARLSRTTAKVDNTAVQDGHQLYQHTFFLASTGAWAVVQQGMSGPAGTARRYHWLSERTASLTCEPHSGIAAQRWGDVVLNLVAAESGPARAAIAELGREAPGRVLAEATRIRAHAERRGPEGPQTDLFAAAEPTIPAAPLAGRPTGAAPYRHPATPRLAMPRRHWVDPLRDLDPRRLATILERTYEAAPQDFEALLTVPGLGPKALRALTLLAEVIYGTTASTRDPARFSFAHGGKDEHPYPVDRSTYDHSLDVLEGALRRARLGRSDRLDALRRLARWSGG